MTTIVEPKHYLEKLWGKQRIDEDQKYRLMKYVLRVDYEGQVLLHNVVTGQLVVLSEAEMALLDYLPLIYNHTMEQLVKDHYLVPEAFDEHEETVGLRTILRSLDSARIKPIVHYTILPTTGCNARCYYCYEQGIKVTRMSEQTAENIVRFIDKHRDKNKRIYITWFGGEPTTATDRIDQICYGLQDLGIEYQSDIVTNGYLFDEVMVRKAKKLWKLTFAQIAVDGVGESYNDIKAYVAVHDDPYERVMRNIGLLLENGISVQMRMNFSPQNHKQFKDLVEEARKRFFNHPLLSVTAHAVITEGNFSSNKPDHEKEKWLTTKLLELNGYGRSVGAKKLRSRLPSLSFVGCEADNDSTIGINPDGRLLRCLENLSEDDMIGSVSAGITNTALAASWKEIFNAEKCIQCILFPHCMKMKNCHGGNRCLSDLDRIEEFSELAKKKFLEWKGKKEGMF